jgi:tryptophan synthase beta chain
MVVRSAVATVSEILQAKHQNLAQRKDKTPIDAVRALASMQGRPIPFLNTIAIDEPPILIGQLLYAPPEDGSEGDDPVAKAVRLVRAGIDVIALFTDAQVYSGGLDDLMFVVRAVHPFKVPVISQDYTFDEYQVVEARAAGAAGIVLDSALVDHATLRTLVSSTQRNRMSAIVRVASEDALDAAIALSPQVISLMLPLPRTLTDIATCRRLRQRIPAHIRVLLDTPIETIEDVLMASRLGLNALFVPCELAHAEQLLALRARLRQSGD